MPSEKVNDQTFPPTVLDDFLAYSSLIQHSKHIWGDPTTSRLETADLGKSHPGLLLGGGGQRWLELGTDFLEQPNSVKSIWTRG